jgi:uncharacterized protein (DUF1501 family)
MASQLPQSFTATTPKGVLYQGGGGAKKKSSKKKGIAAVDADGSMMAMEEDEDGGEAGGSIGMLNGPGNLGQLSALDFLERTEMDAKVSQQEIAKASAKAKNSVPYPGSRLGQNFAMVSRLIAGGMPTRIYYLSLGGFDTHTQQAGAHERLLKDMGDSVAAFLADLKAQGNLGRVTLMTFSEFGRRVKENASGGTDHGAAAPLFLAGGGVKPGLLGQMPSLAPQDLWDGDVKYNTDFRSVYATILEKHLGVKSEPILRKSFPLLPAYG